MNKRLMVMALGLLLALWIGPADAGGKLEGPIRISSEILGYDLQYWIYIPRKDRKPLPELYVTDGQVFLGSGRMAELLDEGTAGFARIEGKHGFCA